MVSDMSGYSIFRVFIPSWRFFDQIGTPLLAQFRFGQNDSSLGEWMSLPTTQTRMPWNLFFNADVSIHHALQSLTERLVSEAQTFASASAANSTSTTRAKITATSTVSSTSPFVPAPVSEAAPLFEANTSYQLMLNWARKRARESDPQARCVQFRIGTRLASSGDGAQNERHNNVHSEVVVSRVHDDV